MSESVITEARASAPWPHTLGARPGPPLLPGDPAPLFFARSSNNPAFQFSSVGGRYVVLCFFGSLASERNQRIYRLLTTRGRRRYDDFFAAFFGVSIDPADERERRAVQSLPGIRHFWDFDGAVTRLYAGEATPAGPEEAGQGGFTVILDPFLRVLANVPFGEPEQHADAVEAIMATLPPPSMHVGVEVPAPVLVLPRVFEPEFCRALIDLYERQGGGESGYMREEDGRTVAVLDHTFKRRKDVSLDVGDEFEPYRAAIRARVRRRILPEIKKVFEFAVTRMERYIISCYDSQSGGFFKPHRDNTTSGTAHRRFAVTINLNAEDYEGGDLRFPEFGDRTYRAPTGGCVVFSCGLLHEATPVTRGRRYACLPFLYDDAAAEIRRRNIDRVSLETIDRTATRGRPAADVAPEPKLS